MEAWGCATADAFGDSPALADELGQLIADGIKTATCSSLAAWREEGEEPPRPGDRELVLDGRNQPWCIIELTEVSERRFCDVDVDFARAEGEGDRTLESWQAGHRQFFERNGGFSPDMLLVCCRFRLIHVFAPRRRTD